VPFQAWLRTELKDVFVDAVLGAHTWLDTARVRALYDEHLHRRRDHGFLLWKLLNLTLWMRKYDVSY
jgi:asparagine synthase (glutamine-hydrolysing)